MSQNNHSFRARHQLGSTRRKATTDTPEQVTARMITRTLEYIHHHRIMIVDQGAGWLMLEAAYDTPLLLIEVTAMYGDETGQYILVRTRLTRKHAAGNVIESQSVQTSGERSATQRIFNTMHTTLAEFPPAREELIP